LHRNGYRHDEKVAILSEDETAFGSRVKDNFPRDNELYLSEDETAFGSPVKDEIPRDNKLYLYYPRDIATLRSEYHRQSIFSTRRQSGAGSPQTSLRRDLSEPEHGAHDTVHTYAGQLTALAQESVLFGISSMIESKRIEFVIIRSSNSLDQLF